MNGRPLRRIFSGVLLTLLLAGPVGPLGAWHVAKVDASASHGTTVSAPGEATVGHGPSCTVCHLLTGLRFTAPAWPPGLVPPLARDAGLAIEAASSSHRWLASDSASRAPPLC